MGMSPKDVATAKRAQHRYDRMRNPRTMAASDAYRSGWDRIFAKSHRKRLSAKQLEVATAVEHARRSR